MQDRETYWVVIPALRQREFEAFRRRWLVENPALGADESRFRLDVMRAEHGTLMLLRAPLRLDLSLIVIPTSPSAEFETRYQAWHQANAALHAQGRFEERIDVVRHRDGIDRRRLQVRVKAR
jgi:hypothetical protein